MDKFYCPNCDRHMDSFIQVKKEEVFNVRGVLIKLKNVQERVCAKCKTGLYDYKLDTPTLIKAYEKYEDKTGKPILEDLLERSIKSAQKTGRTDPTNSEKYIREAIERRKRKGNKKCLG